MPSVLTLTLLFAALTIVFSVLTVVMMMRKRAAGAALRGSDVILSAEQETELSRLLDDGQLISAVRQVMQWTGLRLAPAKDLVDRFRADRPS